MKRTFRVPMLAVVSTTVTVTVDADPDEPMDAVVERAVEEALCNAAPAGLCHQCAAQMNPPEEWYVGNATVVDSYEDVEEVTGE